LSNPLVSVIIPTKDRPRLLERAIRSVLNQTLQDYDVWVVDSSATGSVARVVEEFTDPRLHHVRSPPRGVNAARNVGIRLSSGSLIALLDDDDEWLPEKLERQVELLQRSGPEVGGTFVSHNYVNTERGFSKVVHIFEHKSLLEPNSAGMASATVIKREVFDSVGLFDEEMLGLDDWDMWLKISEKYRFVYVPAVLMNYYATPHNLTSDRPRQVRAQLLMLRKKPYLQHSKRYMAHYYSVVGQHLCQLGFMDKGRRYILLSHRANRGLYPFILFVLTLPGAGVYRRLFFLMHDSPLSLRLEKLIEMTG